MANRERKYIIFDDLSKVAKPDLKLDPEEPGCLTLWLQDMDKYMHGCVANSQEVLYRPHDVIIADRAGRCHTLSEKEMLMKGKAQKPKLKIKLLLPSIQTQSW